VGRPLSALMPAPVNTKTRSVGATEMVMISAPGFERAVYFRSSLSLGIACCLLSAEIILKLNSSYRM
jgi:hypothetical protein